MFHWGCGHLFCSNEKWMLKKLKLWCFLIMVLEKTLTLGSMEIKPVNPKGNQPWIFIGRTDAEAEAPILWSPDVIWIFIGWTDAEAKAPIPWSPDMKSWSFGKDPDTGKDWGQWGKGATEDEMVGWHHGHEFEQTPGDSDEQGNLACCSPWGHKESDVA